MVLQKMSFSRLRVLSALTFTESPPTEFRVFAAGVNDSTEGPSMFDGVAAKSVMAAYRQHGVDVMIDREHDSLDRVTRQIRADAADALGWCQLELREGELWAVNVRWTTEGAERLRAKKQRYISPAFRVDEEGRVKSLLNIALTSLPATYQTPALIAASQRSGVNRRGGVRKRNMLSIEQVKAALAAIQSGDTEGALTILMDLIASAASGGETETEAPVEETLAETPEPPPEGAPEEETRCAAPERKRSQVESRARQIEEGLELTQLRSRVAALETEKAARELVERRSLVGELVRLGRELPATAWAGKPEDRRPVARLMNEPLDELRARVAAYKADSGDSGVVRSRRAEAPAERLDEFETLAQERAASLPVERRARFLELVATRRTR